MAMNRRVAPLALAIILVAVLGATSASATVVPPTLTGETFVDESPDIMATCNPNGTSTISFSASGTAVGPYPGTFTETGTATLGPQTEVPPPGGASPTTLLTFDAVFTIDSPVGQVVGTKRLFKQVTDPSFEVAVAQCNTFGGAELVDAIDRFTVQYDAQIETEGEQFTDRGLVPLVAVQRIRNVSETPPIITWQVFYEDFLSELATPEPRTTPGQATGGGQIANGITFGLTAQSNQNGIRGNCTVIDRGTNQKVKCLDVTTYSQTATHATFSGRATVNGVETTYRIDVNDTAEPGDGADTFTLTTTSGYNASGVLTEGNIQVHN
jgi:hypothetical protein